MLRGFSKQRVRTNTIKDGVAVIREILHASHRRHTCRLLTYAEFLDAVYHQYLLGGWEEERLEVDEEAEGEHDYEAGSIIAGDPLPDAGHAPPRYTV